LGLTQHRELAAQAATVTFVLLLLSKVEEEVGEAVLLLFLEELLLAPVAEMVALWHIMLLLTPQVAAPADILVTVA
jgi:hypothetical protein